MFEAALILLFMAIFVAVPLRILMGLCSVLRTAWSQWSYRSAVRREQHRQAEMGASHRPHADARSRLEQRRREREVARRSRLESDRRQRREETERRQAAEEKRRKNDARARCECRWSTCAPHIAKKYSRADFDRFLQTFMTDAHPADEVESRALQLLRILDGFFEEREATKPARRFETLEDVTHWFIEQQERIGRLPLDEQTRDEHLARLNATYSELSERMLETPR